MTTDRVTATYRIETPYTLEHAAQVMAGEQSTGTFVKVAGETDELRRRHGARIEAIRPLEAVADPSLPGVQLPEDGASEFRRGDVDLSFPLENFGPNIPNLLATVHGNLYELREFSGLKLLDLELPGAFADAYAGPKFGIDGTRRLTGVEDGPIIGTIIKPNVGYPPEELRGVVRQLAMSGIDFIKDDELIANPPYSPLEERVRVVMEEIERAADRTGKRAMYAFNITDDIQRLPRHHETVVAGGGSCVMVSINSVGFTGVAYLNRYSQVPIHGHRNGWGALTRSPMLGMEFAAYQKLCRLAGVDQLHTSGLDNKFFESNESVLASIRGCLEPLLGGYPAIPVISSGQWAGQAPATYRQLGTTDVMHLAGGGIHGHPGGVAAGVQALRQGWEAARRGIPLERYARDHDALQQSIEMFRGITGPGSDRRRG